MELVQHLFHAGPRGGRHRSDGSPRVRVEGGDGRGVRVVHRTDPGLQGRAAPQHDPRRWGGPDQPRAPEAQGHAQG